MKHILSRIHSSKADSTLVIFIISIPLLILSIGFSIDLTKSVNASNALKSMAQTSAETSVKTVDSRGSLNNDTVKSFINEYKTQSSPSASHTNETQVYQSEKCSTAVIDGQTRQLPYMVIKLGTSRSINDAGVTNATTWTVEGYDDPDIKALGSTKYKVISVDVYDSSTNLFGVYGLSGCQLHKSTVSAISFASNSDN